MRLLGVALLLACAPGLALAAEPAATPKPRPPDLADAIAGTWSGDVISDSQGSSRSGVTLSIARMGKNLVSIHSDYPRLPVVEVRLTAAMASIVNQDGNTALAWDRSKSPPQLDISFNNEVSWSGTRR